MRRFGTLLTLIIGLGIGTVMAVPSSPGADQNKIGQLIAKLGSDNFRERDAANKELDAIGEPALEALRKAAKSNDMEVAKRATDLIGKIEQRAENARLLAPTYVELNLKEATLDDAVAELSKKSGYSIVIGGDKTKMSDRRVTLETGRVPFWKALDMLCQKAGLVEADPNTPLPGGIDLPGQPLPPQVQPLPIRIQPVKPINIKPIQIKPINVKPLPAPKPVEDKPEPKPVEKPAIPQGFSADQPAPQKEVPPQPAQPQPVQIQIQVQAAPPVQAQPAPIGGFKLAPNVNNGQIIVLVDGKPNMSAADVESAVRIRAVNNPAVLANYTPVPNGEVGILLEVKVEPKLQLQQLLGVKIDKAIDNHDQMLTPTMVSGLIGGPQTEEERLIRMKVMQLQAQAPVQIQIGGGKPGYAGPGIYYGNSYLPARMKKGEKEPKSLKEVRGTVSLKMRTGMEELVAVENILKAKGESVKGKGESTLKVIDVTKAENGDITVQVELQFSNEVQPKVNQPNRFPQPQPPAINGNIRLQIAPAPAAPPPPAVPPQGGAVPGAQGGIASPAVYNYLGLDLVDAKGESLQLVKMQTTRNQWMGNARSVSTTMTFKPQKEQEAAKFVFRGTRNAAVDVPFLLKDVPLK